MRKENTKRQQETFRKYAENTLKLLSSAQAILTHENHGTFAPQLKLSNNGKTFEIAKILEGKHVPFVFVSGSSQEELPFELHSTPFIPKPFSAAQISECLADEGHPPEGHVQ